MTEPSSQGSEHPPPTYAPTQPQILVVPLPDAPSFFWGRTVQGEVFVKGLGEEGTSIVRSLMVELRLINRLPEHATLELCSLPIQTLYLADTGSSSSSPGQGFPASHRFSVPLPPCLPDGSALPGTLNLNMADQGEVRWELSVRLALQSGDIITELVPVEGTPPDACSDEIEEPLEVEESLERNGVRVRLLLDCDRPRLGDLLRVGVEVRAKGRERTGLAGLVSQPDPAETLRPLRRARLELVRFVDIMTTPHASTSASTPANTHITLLHASGKSLRYPGASSSYPPLRVLFTLPTAPVHPNIIPTWGETTYHVPYHSVRFVVRVTLGFGASIDGTGMSDGAGDWTIEHAINIRPSAWHEPRTFVIERGLQPDLGLGDASTEGESEDEREAYRRKGRDVVGASGTIRAGQPDDLPPPFDGAGPSGSHSAGDSGGLPSFTESEAQMRSGQAPLLPETVTTERLVPVSYEDGEPFVDRATSIGRRGSLGGELGTWIEYDGYETFSMAPPPAAASFGVGGSMDPPSEDEHNAQQHVVGDMVAQLGLPGTAVPDHPEDLMEQLGLGQGTRVIDLQDDLPPGIDEPSLPALPGFGTRSFSPTSIGRTRPGPPPLPVPVDADHPPSFDASEAAEAVGGVARSRVGSLVPLGAPQEAPPGYFGSAGGGPPAYS